MAVEASREAADGRLVLLTGLASLAVVSAAAFGRVYQGHGPTLRLALVALVALALAALLERRSLVLATLVSAAGLVIAASLLVFPHTTVVGLPTMRTLHQAVSAFGSVARTSAVQVAPAPPLAPLLLAGVTAAWTAAFAAHALAVRARSPLLAIAPPACLLVFAGIVMEDGARPMYVFVFLAAGLAVLFADALRRVGSWGPVSVWHERRSIRSGGGTTARGAWRVAIGCLVVALFMPWLLPGFGSRALLSVRGGAATQVSIDPTVDIRPRLLQNPPTQLFDIQSSRASYWRFLTLDTFDGRRWTSSRSLTAGTQPYGNQLDTDLPALPCANPDTSDPVALRFFPQDCPPGYPDDGPTVLTVEQHYTFGPLSQPWLPIAPEPLSAGIAGEDSRFDPVTSALVLPNGTFRGFSYSALSLAVVPTPDELRAIPSLEVPENPNWTHYVTLPDNIPPQISQIANQIVTEADATTPYDQVTAIQDYLQGFKYDPRVPAPDSVNDLVYFLTKSKRGYCQQFAGTMGVMLRALGLPTRLADGFTQGDYESTTRSYSVTTQNAHVWVEVEFPGYGWLAFEPTPTRTNPIASSYDAPVILGGITTCPGRIVRGRCAGGDGVGAGLGGVGGRLTGPAQKLLQPALGGPLVSAPTKAVVKPEPLGHRLRRIGLYLALGLAVLLLVATPPVKGLARRLRLRRPRGPGERVTTAYEVLCEEAADVGLGRRPFETPFEYQRRVVAFAPESGAAMERLTDLTLRANYAQNGIGAPEADEAVALSRTVSRVLRKASRAIRRVAGWYRIGSWDPGERWIGPDREDLRPRASLPG
jgi:transglutaminase-like putative cysteine protease